MTYFTKREKEKMEFNFSKQFNFMIEKLFFWNWVYWLVNVLCINLPTFYWSIFLIAADKVSNANTYCDCFITQA